MHVTRTHLIVILVFVVVVVGAAVAISAMTRAGTANLPGTGSPGDSPSPAPAVLVGAGDIAECPTDADERTAELLDEVVAEHPDAIVYTTGDNAYPHGTFDNLIDC